MDIIITTTRGRQGLHATSLRTWSVSDFFTKHIPTCIRWPTAWVSVAGSGEPAKLFSKKLVRERYKVYDCLPEWKYLFTLKK